MKKRNSKGQFKTDYTGGFQFLGMVLFTSCFGLGISIGSGNFASLVGTEAKAEYQVEVVANNSDDVTLGGLAKIATESATSTPAPITPEPEPSLSDKQEVMSYILEVFGDDADRAIWIAKCESGLRKDAINPNNPNGTTDYGVFQINSVHLKKRGDKFTNDWRENVRVAKKIFDEQGFRPWVCATAIGEKNYLSSK